MFSTLLFVDERHSIETFHLQRSFPCQIRIRQNSSADSFGDRRVWRQSRRITQCTQIHIDFHDITDDFSCFY